MTDVTIYTKTTCGFCHSAKRLLDQKGLEFTEISVDADRELWNKMVEDSGQRTVPQIWINENWIGGCTDLYALERSGKLDQIIANK